MGLLALTLAAKPAKLTRDQKLALKMRAKGAPDVADRTPDRASQQAVRGVPRLCGPVRHHHHAAAAIPVFEKTYESLKSTCSSQNSSKASSTASAASSADLSAFKLTRPPKCMPDTENPELLKNLNFVSPKTGVYRPMPEGSRRYKQSCNVM